MLDTQVIPVKRLSTNAKLPSRNNEEDAGLDIYTTESRTLQPGELHLFSTGIAMELPRGYVGLLWDRSGMGVKGVHRLAGVLDSTYRGEIKVVLVNLSEKPIEIKEGDKIIQCIIQQYLPTKIVEVEQLSSSNRGEKGFGSSGR